MTQDDWAKLLDGLRYESCKPSYYWKHPYHMEAGTEDQVEQRDKFEKEQGYDSLI